jgi:hypothetical protein
MIGRHLVGNAVADRSDTMTYPCAVRAGKPRARTCVIGAMCPHPELRRGTTEL